MCSLLVPGLYCIRSWTGRPQQIDEVKHSGESVCVRKREESKSSFPADFNLSMGWAWQFRPYSSRWSRQVTASKATSGGRGRSDLVLRQVHCSVVCLWNMCIDTHCKHFKEEGTSRMGWIARGAGERKEMDVWSCRVMPNSGLDLFRCRFSPGRHACVVLLPVSWCIKTLIKSFALH